MLCRYYYGNYYSIKHNMLDVLRSNTCIYKGRDKIICNQLVYSYMLSAMCVEMIYIIKLSYIAIAISAIEL